ncbi:MAG: response regulator transcription factor [Emergencia sp.]|jgi:DNA-binding response OmpR family regulator|uniref:Stage 0 sporulation protein A homolog n=2 Tax=Clostridia TaxID=186801 RepID=A0A845QKV7_9FIRM|nr:MULTISPECIES: response regulator transcription factor [Clostridia]MCI9476427.1 response regulator transcription factor [Emergencia sp.]MCI9640538.1 response regulator transcription factor [Emergencia sp.]NBH62720.1 DNA-binding response regulator [Anaerotruncus colihominis]NCE99607.1 DNA-binding response regulator [Emergencia sp. 1XD21-10]NCF03375.1 DNA-binding response regulator [Anaerotruncus sp. 80]
MNILVCDDDKEIAGAIEIYLRNEGYTVFKAFDGIEALNYARNQQLHLIIMDVMMPKMDGVQATMKIREEKNIPIIMLSAKSEDYDKITGLNVGADDYITKPFNPLELIARVKSQLRRYVDLGSMEKKSGVYKTGGLEVDDDEKAVRIDGEYVTVTPTEFGILKLLTENAGKVFSMEQIYENVWNEPAYNPENTVAVHIRRIREKIEINPKNPKYLKVVWGIGYKIEKL